MDVSCRGIAPNGEAVKQPAKNKAINDQQKRSLACKCLILLIWISFFIQLATVLRMCSS